MTDEQALIEAQKIWATAFLRKEPYEDKVLHQVCANWDGLAKPLIVILRHGFSWDEVFPHGK